ncbi:MAG: radical SAM protein [Candidatus Omnitrophica bacterium]|nr:radical SAM protein [Candidatus Omnitrophota bacterium]
MNDLSRMLNGLFLYAKVGLPRMTLRKAWVMLSYWVRTTFLGHRIPWLIELSVTYRCQCRCKHCSVSNYFEQAGKKPEMTSDEIKSILRQAVALGIPKVDFFGGEPLLRSDIVDLVRYAENLGIYSSVTTNALLLDRAMMQSLSTAGISCINISIDSTSDEEHDQLRGVKGIYEKAVNAFSLCKDARIPCIFSTYVTRKRIQGFLPGEMDNSPFTELIRLAREVKATAVRVLFPIISGEWVKKKEVELSEQEKAVVIKAIDPSFVFVEGAFSVVNGKKVCQALSGKMINISPYGDIQICVAFPNSFGNVVREGLKPAIDKMWDHSIYKKNKDGSCCSTDDLKV